MADIVVEISVSPDPPLPGFPFEFGPEMGSFCGTWLAGPRRSPHERPRRFPGDCDFPRFLGESALCFRRSRSAEADGMTMIRIDGGGRETHVEIPLEGGSLFLSDIALLGPREVVMLVGNDLYGWDGTETARLDDDLVSFIRKAGDAVYYAGCTYPGWTCSLSRIDRQLRIETLWRSALRDVSRVHVDPDGSLLLDVWGPIDRSAPETRELIRLEPGLDAATTVLWSREDGPER